MADTIKISKDKLKSVKSTYSDMSSQLKDGASYVEDGASQGCFNAAKTAIEATAQGTEEVLKSFDAYLGSVAQAFDDADIKMSQDIGDPTPNTLRDIKNSDAYKKLREQETKNDPSAPKTDLEAEAARS